MENKILIFVLLLLFLFFSFSGVLAAPSYSYEPMEKIPGTTESISYFPDYVKAIYKFGIWAVGIAAVLMISVGGFMYFSSAGNTSKLEKAKVVIRDSIFGIIAVLTAYLILYVINPDLVNVSLESLSGLNKSSISSDSSSASKTLNLNEGSPIESIILIPGKPPFELFEGGADKIILNRLILPDFTFSAKAMESGSLDYNFNYLIDPSGKIIISNHNPQQGKYKLYFTFKDGAGNQIRVEIIINVSRTTKEISPYIITSYLPTAVVGEEYYHAIDFFQGNPVQNKLSLAVFGLPEGLNFDQNQNTISGNPSKAGNYEITINLLQEAELIDSKKIILQVKSATDDEEDGGNDIEQGTAEIERIITYSSSVLADKLKQDVYTADVSCPSGYMVVDCIRKGSDGRIVADKNSNGIPQLNLHMDPDQNKCYLGYYINEPVQLGQVGAVCVKSEGLQRSITYSSSVSADKLNQDVYTADVSCPSGYTVIGCVRKGSDGRIVADKNSNGIPQLNLHMNPDQNKCYLGYYTTSALQLGQVGAVCVKSEGLQRSITYSSSVSADKLNQDVYTADVSCPSDYTVIGCIRKGSDGRIVADKNSNGIPQLNLHMNPEQNKCYLGYYINEPVQLGQVGAVCVKGEGEGGGEEDQYCINECSNYGQIRCVDGNKTETCGNFDDDTCLEWGVSQACPNEQICQDGNCIAQEEGKTIMIFAHQDDDLLFMLPFWEESKKFILTALPTTPSHMNVVNQHPDYYKNNWVAIRGEVSIDEYKNFWLNNDLRKTEITYDKIKTRLRPYFLDENVEKVVTHNNWGEYGHTHHRLVNKVVRDLAVEYKKDVWAISMVRYNPDIAGLPYVNTGTFNLESVTKSFSDSLFKEMKLIYQQEEESPSSEGLNIWSWHDGENEYPWRNRTFIEIVDDGEDFTVNNSEIQNLMNTIPVFGE